MSAVDFLSSVADIQNKPSSGKNKSAFFKGLNYNFNPTKGDKTLYEVHTMRLPELRKYAKKYIKLSKLDTTTGKRVQLRKKEIIKELGVK